MCYQRIYLPRFSGYLNVINVLDEDEKLTFLAHASFPTRCRTRKGASLSSGLGVYLASLRENALGASLHPVPGFRHFKVFTVRVKVFELRDAAQVHISVGGQVKMYFMFLFAG